ncbi:3-hydroxybenzoate 4-monooxygenase [Labeo rohita]|uniref:3-hydroxybenzoate 4-monooxygenase n=1 Tax=Labeo rohita TaxID=84645 RepID=A0ABQ8LZG1_LABRO|nr:3-hydroxybenzoate 4-monooxygenase [Labeo rohita]
MALIEEFPCLKDISVNGYGAFYTPGWNHRPATGFIEERLRNIRKRMRKLSRPQRHEEDTSHRMVIPENRGDVALLVLPLLLPPTVYKIGQKVFRPSIDKAGKAFIDLQPVGTNMVEFLKQAESTKHHTFVMAMGNG